MNVVKCTCTFNHPDTFLFADNQNESGMACAVAETQISTLPSTQMNDSLSALPSPQINVHNKMNLRNYDKKYRNRSLITLPQQNRNHNKKSKSKSRNRSLITLPSQNTIQNQSYNAQPIFVYAVYRCSYIMLLLCLQVHKSQLLCVSGHINISSDFMDGCLWAYIKVSLCVEIR